MKKLLLLLPLLSLNFLKAQLSPMMPIYPGCEQFDTKQELVKCFNNHVKEITNSYYHLNQNLLAYFQYPFINGKVTFMLDTKGEFEYKNDAERSKEFNLMANDFFVFYNSYLKINNIVITPAKSGDGRPAKLAFNMPINFDRPINQTLKGDEEIIRFTINMDQQYVVKQDADYNFTIYNQQGEMVFKTNTMLDFFRHPILKQLIDSDQNLITEQEVNGKKIKIEVFNLFRNQSNELKILYFEDNKMIKEFNNMDVFLNSEFAKYVF